MKTLAILRTLDLNSGIGAVPWMRQFVKSLTPVIIHQTQSYDPTLTARFFRKYAGVKSDFGQFKEIAKAPRDLDLIIILHEYDWLTKERLKFLRDTFLQAKIAFYDYEVPLNLPEFATDERYGTSPFLRESNAWDILDAVIIPSRGARNRVEELTGLTPITNWFAVDPKSYLENEEYRILKPGENGPALCFQGKSRFYREEEIQFMLEKPAAQKGYSIINASNGGFDFEWFKAYSYASKINLSITRSPFAKVYASSISRPFELAAMRCCIVSNPCLGLSEWFEEGKEILTVDSTEKAIEVYDSLVSDPEARLWMGKNAYARVIRDHTIQARTEELLEKLHLRPNILEKA